MVDSLIVLYDRDEEVFTSNGLGALPDAASCIVTEERNGGYEVEMEYPLTGSHFQEIQKRRILYVKPNPYDDPQPFRIYSITKPINGIVTIHAAHLSYDTSGSIVKLFPADAGSASAAMSYLKNFSVPSTPFTFFTNVGKSGTMSVPKPSSIRSLLGGSDGSILDTFGGEYLFDKWNISLLESRGADRGVTIRYGKNMTDLEQEENDTDFYTGVYPFWYSESEDGGLVTLSANNGIVNAFGTYDFVKIMPLDLSSEDFSKETTDSEGYVTTIEKPTEAELLAAAKKYISDNKIGVPKVSLDVSFVMLAQTEEYKDFARLETVKLCDTVTVEFEKLGVKTTAKCIKTVYNVLTGKYNSIELGEPKSSLAETVSNQGTLIEEASDKSYMEHAIQNATDLIMSGKLGGYVTVTKNEIYIADSKDLDKAVKVWRWNSGGLGYSKSGKNGPFETAITSDGKIVADYISTGNLDCSVLNVSNIHGDSILVDTIGALNGINQLTDGYQYVKTGWLGVNDRGYNEYGIAVGRISTNDDGSLVKTSSEYVKITSGRVSFMQNGTEVAYMSGGKLYIANGDVVASDFKFTGGSSIKAQLEALANSVSGDGNSSLEIDINGGGWLRLTTASSSDYAVELGSSGALRMVANSGDIFLKAGAATIQMHHDTGKVSISNLDAVPVFG
jgi:phage minor structural protein|nr:MAG TPA: tail protein [Bacteriophage sp.]